MTDHKPWQAMRWPDDGDDSYDAVCRRAAIHRWINDNGGKTEVKLAEGIKGAYTVLLNENGYETPIYGGFWVLRDTAGHFYVSPTAFSAMDIS